MLVIEIIRCRHSTSFTTSIFLFLSLSLSLYFSVGSFISVYTVDSSSIVLRATTRQQTSLKIRIKRGKGLNMAAHNELLSLLLSKGLRSPEGTRDLENITRLTVNPHFAHVVLLSQSDYLPKFLLFLTSDQAPPALFTYTPTRFSFTRACFSTVLSF